MCVEVLFICGHSCEGNFSDEDPKGIYEELAGLKDYKVAMRYCPACQKKTIEGKQLGTGTTDPGNEGNSSSA